MRSRVSLVAAVLAATPLAAQNVPLPPEAGASAGPSGTAGTGTPVGYDAVVYAEVEPGAPGVAVTAPLPVGTYAEVTDLASGRTVLAAVVATAPEVRLSATAAQALGVTARTGVRLRAVAASPADANALRQGQLASPRLDTPEAVLRPLRRQLPAQAAAAPSRRLRVPKAPRTPAPERMASADRTVMDVTPPPPTALRVEPKPARTARRGADDPPPGPPPTDVPETRLVPPPTAAAPPVAADVPATRLIPPAAATPARFVVQVTSVAQEERARNLARTLNGIVARTGEGWQVRLGPFADLPAAQAARDGAVARGYGDAAIFIAD